MPNDITKNVKFDASIQIEKRVSIVRVSGEVDIATAPLLSERLQEATNEAMSDLQLVVADLTNVTFLDSSGLGALIDHQGTMKAKDDSIAFRLVVSEPHILKVFAITGLDQVLPISATLEDAIGTLV